MSFTQKKHQFQVQIRKKNLHNRLSTMRSALYKQNSQQEKQEIIYQKAKELIQQLNEQNFIEHIQKIKSFSYGFNERTIVLFVEVINKLCQIIANLDNIKQLANSMEKDNIYNDILTIFINASCQESYKWPNQQYLPIIKNILIEPRQINTLWFLANLLYLRNQTSEALCRELIQYDTIQFCSSRLNQKFKNQNDLIVVSFYICSFLTNSNFLVLKEYKSIIVLLQSLISLNNQEIDWLIAQSLVDHASNLKNCNYQILYSKVLKKFGQYCKMKKSKIVAKYLEFIKLYLKSQIIELIQEQKQNQYIEQKEQKEHKQKQTDKNAKTLKDNKKIYKQNYQRFVTTSLLNLTYCLQTRSPQLKCSLLQICYLLVENYFQFIDFQSQWLYLNLAGQLQKLVKSPLSKYNDKTIFHQLRYTSILLVKIISGKDQNEKHFSEILQQFLKQNNILVILTDIIKEKEEAQIINQACTLLYYLIASFNYFKANIQQRILEELILALEVSITKVKNEELFNKMDDLLKCIRQIQI